jgi:hypothetical protein
MSQTLRPEDKEERKRVLKLEPNLYDVIPLKFQTLLHGCDINTVPKESTTVSANATLESSTDEKKKSDSKIKVDPSVPPSKDFLWMDVMLKRRGPVRPFGSSLTLFDEKVDFSGQRRYEDPDECPRIVIEEKYADIVHTTHLFFGMCAKINVLFNRLRSGKYKKKTTKSLFLEDLKKEIDSMTYDKVVLQSQTNRPHERKDSSVTTVIVEDKRRKSSLAKGAGVKTVSTRPINYESSINVTASASMGSTAGLMAPFSSNPCFDSQNAMYSEFLIHRADKDSPMKNSFSGVTDQTGPPLTKASLNCSIKCKRRRVYVSEEQFLMIFRDENLAQIEDEASIVYDNIMTEALYYDYVVGCSFDASGYYGYFMDYTNHDRPNTFHFETKCLTSSPVIEKIDSQDLVFIREIPPPVVRPTSFKEAPLPSVARDAVFQIPLKPHNPRNSQPMSRRPAQNYKEDFKKYTSELDLELASATLITMRDSCSPELEPISKPKLPLFSDAVRQPIYRQSSQNIIKRPHGQAFAPTNQTRAQNCYVFHHYVPPSTNDPKRRKLK